MLNNTDCGSKLYRFLIIALSKTKSLASPLQGSEITPDGDI